MDIKNQGKDLSISMMRFISMCMIVAYHISFYYNFRNGKWLYIGVSVFLCISGFLYAKKDISDDINFIRRSFKKILFDYYIYIILLIPFYFLFAPDYINIKQAVATFFFVSLVGLEHFWFIPYMLACYAITPLLSKFCAKLHRFDNRQFLGILICTMAVIEIILTLFIERFDPSRIFCYVLPFMISHRLQSSKLTMKTVLMWLIPICLILAVFMPGVTSQLEGYFSAIYGKIFKYSISFFGVTGFFIFYEIFKKIKLNESSIMRKLLSFSDKYSYDVYLTHHVYIGKPFWISTIFESVFLNITFILILIAISGWLLKSIANRLSKAFRKLQGNAISKDVNTGLSG